MYRRIGLAPDIKEIKRKEYARTVRNIRLILEGRSEILIQKLSRRMGHYAKEHKFEEAAKIRDQIAALSSIGLIQSGFSRQDELQDLKKLLKLNKLPQRIEAFDISDISGKEATGSMVSFYRGLTDKNNYRRFRIKTVEGIDDYKMLSEVIHRRYRRLIAEKLPLPDLILIDGGKSHLLTAQRELEKLNIAIPLISIAKEQENVYIKDSRSPIKFVYDTPALNLIRRIRDEAHRFAVSYHHILRRKKIIGR
jgi:excinuclease ABC subunit C